jgi:hypothetical protein
MKRDYEKAKEAESQLWVIEKGQPILRKSIGWFLDLWYVDGLEALEEADVSDDLKQQVLELVFESYSSRDPYRGAVIAEKIGKSKDIIIQLAEEALEFDLTKNPYSGIYVMDVHADQIIGRFSLDPQRVSIIAKQAFEKRMASKDRRDHEIAEKVIKPLIRA